MSKKKKIIVYCISAILLIIATSIFVYKYVINESPVYIFDYSGYFEDYKTISKTFTESKR